jgi:hypothetical protein
MEATARIELAIGVLQTLALPLGYVALTSPIVGLLYPGDGRGLPERYGTPRRGHGCDLRAPC